MNLNIKNVECFNIEKTLRTKIIYESLCIPGEGNVVVAGCPVARVVGITVGTGVVADTHTIPAHTHRYKAPMFELV